MSAKERRSAFLPWTLWQTKMVEGRWEESEPWRWYWLRPIVEDGEGGWFLVEADDNFHLHQPPSPVEQ